MCCLSYINEWSWPSWIDPVLIVDCVDCYRLLIVIDWCFDVRCWCCGWGRHRSTSLTTDLRWESIDWDFEVTVVDVGGWGQRRLTSSLADLPVDCGLLTIDCVVQIWHVTKLRDFTHIVAGNIDCFDCVDCENCSEAPWVRRLIVLIGIL